MGQSTDDQSPNARTCEFTRDGIRLVYDDLGAGPAVLFSHCWLFDHRQFPQAPAVAQAGYRVLNVDNRGHGRSGPCRLRHTMWDVADDLIAVLDDAGEDQAVVVGLSIGGYAALRAALRHPSRVRGLVLAGTTAGLMTRLHRMEIRALWPLFLTPLRPLALMPFIKALFGPTTRRTQPALVAEWRRRWLAQFARDPRSTLATGKAALFRHEDLTPELGTITQPTLVITGEQDPYVAAAIAMAAGIPGAHLVVIPEAGHTTALEAPERFERELLDFLHDLGKPDDGSSPTATTVLPELAGVS